MRVVVSVMHVLLFTSLFAHHVDETPGGFAVRNQIARAVCDAIIRAHQDGRRFRVFIVIPLLPAFEAEVSHVNAATTRLIVHWHQQTMSKNESWNMLDYLRGAGVDPAEHLSFCSLRTHGPLGVSPFSSEMAVVTPAGDEEDVVGGASMTRPLVTEQVYVHSKMMIVDDRLTIIGSANINDRSMVGNRDGYAGSERRDYLPRTDCLSIHTVNLL